ncbi:MAG: DUF1289 domain-containing protein [Gammaproteobacteria bacterium]|nr:MAG: DUF1289 domain-containing protein [Gammaproteobacteria bacterium]TDJ36242.1 MAG: DUF1289 domain-containing protein [Gammaproteobacteria bacterium]
MNHRRTPCVGICSTTYGDLVCRGCKRFAHEIVQWNGFREDQQDRVWERLMDLRTGAVTSLVRIVHPKQLLASAISLNVPDAAKLPRAQLAYEVLRRMPSRGLKLSTTGLAPVANDATGLLSADPVRILKQIEGEFYQRSLAHYEHNFKTPVQ